MVIPNMMREKQKMDALDHKTMEMGGIDLLKLNSNM